MINVYSLMVEHQQTYHPYNKQSALENQILKVGVFQPPTRGRLITVLGEEW